MKAFVLILASVVTIGEIIVSLYFILKNENKEASISEVALSFFMIGYFLLSIQLERKKIVAICLAQYICVKAFLVVVMIIARKYSFYVVMKTAGAKKKNEENWISKKYSDPKKLKEINRLRKIKYWPQLKLGLPGMAYQKHAVTKVRFSRNGFPKFKSYYDVKLKYTDLKKSRTQHFKICNQKLYDEVSKSQELRHKLQLTKKDVEELSRGETPKKYVWHHHQETGVLQLVNRDIHEKTYHIGGYSIWGGKE